MNKKGLRHHTLIQMTISAFVLMLSLTEVNAQIINNNTSAGSGVDGEKTAEEYDLTDKDRFESQVFVHDGLNNRQIQEECEKLKDSRACQGRGGTKFLGIDSGMVQAVSKVYSMFGAVMGASGGGGFSAPKAEAPAEGATETATEGQASEGESEGKQDYCAYIPAVGETLATFTQQLGQQTIAAESQGQETQQKAQLYQASRSHGTRAKTAKMQGTVWGSTAACYGAYMASGKIAIDWKVIAKAAGAGFLTIFWFNEAKQQEHYASEVKRIADELPGRGVCNPHTEKDCYCAQPETQYDPTHCVPELHKKAVATTSFRVPCADKDMKPDASCDCIGADACFDTEYFSNIKAPGFVQFANSAGGKDFRDLTRGSLNNGTLAAGSNSNSARARKLLGDLGPKVKTSPSLDKSGLSANDAFTSLGVPGSVARLLASQKVNSQGKNRVASLTSGFGKGTGNFSNQKRAASRKTGVLRFNRAKASVGPKKKSSSSSAFKFKRKKSKTRSGAKTLKFAQRAQKSAQITKNKDRPIFEIISRRYQVSGWKRLDIQ
jgi:hypothetical protein